VVIFGFKNGGAKLFKAINGSDLISFFHDYKLLNLVQVFALLVVLAFVYEL
jgi:hypothetical protein